MTVCDPERLPASGKANGTTEAMPPANCMIVRVRHRARPLRGVVACQWGASRKCEHAPFAQDPAQFCAWPRRATSDRHIERENLGTNGWPRGYVVGIPVPGGRNGGSDPVLIIERAAGGLAGARGQQSTGQQRPAEPRTDGCGGLLPDRRAY